MHVYYRLAVDFIDETIEPIMDQINDLNEDDADTWSFSISMIIDEQKEVHTVHRPYKDKYDMFFNDIIRDAVKGYKHKMRFDHFNWIIEKSDKKKCRVYLFLLG